MHDSSRTNLQEHHKQRHPDGNFRQETAKQPPLHFVSRSGLQSTANITSPLSLSELRPKKGHHLSI